MRKAKDYTSALIDDLLDEISADEQEMTDKRMLLAARIDEAIKAKGWKKKSFAEAMNKLPSEISKWLSGTHNFNTDTLFDIERVLNIRLINLTNTQLIHISNYHTNVTQKAVISKNNLHVGFINPQSLIQSFQYAESNSKFKIDQNSFKYQAS